MVPPGEPDPEREPLAARSLSRPHPERLAPDDPDYEEIVRAHDDTLRAGTDTYRDPRSGLAVLTAAYLARRGQCCGSGCRHCPYLS